MIERDCLLAWRIISTRMVCLLKVLFVEPFIVFFILSMIERFFIFCLRKGILTPLILILLFISMIPLCWLLLVVHEVISVIARLVLWIHTMIREWGDFLQLPPYYRLLLYLLFDLNAFRELLSPHLFVWFQFLLKSVTRFTK